MLKRKAASGLEIAFLIFAVLLLAVPADRYLFGRWTWAADLSIPVGRIAILVAAGIAFIAIAPLRRICRELLMPPIPRAQLGEVAAAAVLDYCIGFAAFGGFALLWWWNGGEAGLAARASRPTDLEQLQQALSVGGVVGSVLGAGLLAPVIEELVFRGMLYRRWEHQWGWLPAAIASSIVFALAHPRTIYPQFVSGLLEVCVYRRTGSLRAAIMVHAVYNLSVWYPLAGRFVLPAGRESGRLDVWTPNLVCLGLILVAMPVYLWMSRDGAVKDARLSAAPGSSDA